MQGAKDSKLFSIPKGRALQAQLLLIVAVTFGGGGSGAGAFNLIIQLLAIAVIAVNAKAFTDFFLHAPRFLTILVGISLLLPLLQCVPLPPFIWQKLPGRDLVSDSLALVNENETWFSMSVDMQRTFIAFLSLIPSLAIIITTWNLSHAQKRQILLVVAMLGFFVVALGTQQLAMGNKSLFLFKEAFGSSNLQGTFANRNSAGLFLDISLCALIGIFPWARLTSTSAIAASATAILLIIGLILTKSRSSIVLVTIPMLMIVFQTAKSLKFAKAGPKAIIIIVICFGILTSTAVIFSRENLRIQNSLSRFEDIEDVRPLIWSDTIGSIVRFWPIGSGIGTFDEVFQVDETLENLGPGRAARAHNEYLEMILESGLAGAALLVGWAVFLLGRSFQAFRIRGIWLAPTGVFALLAFQSILDYPLRNQTLLCIAGLMLAVWAKNPSEDKPLY